ncbi:hypothetical protein TBLA_0D02320 [Henningerozyma blattae CBS 6284]|uniref:Rho-GAP domain-containing protein n=1 Tax=Henningerozyma blattae (strain ATCC 34711 / CBS 6284 / DSM 70876 / NBRC 10599 / NRRL Y-10934 / UCD 77-7) TaxID=1071380 RepID=I2H2Y4_HENB6|nr:hypothetical protein TBLA_0D02320 [Tetrapisispora blattae CBS 6284]CCH60736.1 hypothetical protein TBLA_0D02320 [Tetrapisispora blattae CBS 6284]
MPSFADSFWSEDLTSGLEKLFNQMYHGNDQNNLFIQLFASRMQFEVSYGRQLYTINDNIENLEEFHLKSEFYTTDSAFSHLLNKMSNEGDYHLNIASNIEILVLRPFSKWCKEHHDRIKYSEKTLKKSVENFKKSKTMINKLETEYFNKCRSLEDFKRLNFNEKDLGDTVETLKLFEKKNQQVQKENDHKKFATLASIDFDYITMRQTLKLLLLDLPKSDYKLPFLKFTITNTNNGNEITNFLLEQMSLKDVEQAEQFGQDLLNLGFIKYCNGVGNSFANSKKFQFQWKPYAYKFANIQIPDSQSISFTTTAATAATPTVTTSTKRSTSESGSLDSISLSTTITPTPPSTNATSTPNGKATDINIDNDKINSETVIEYHKPKPKNSPVPISDDLLALMTKHVSEKENTLFKLIRDVDKSDNKYFEECFKMDDLRCSIEELMIDHLSFMEKCEIDRLNAIKKATFDFCSIIGNKVISLKTCIEGMMEAENSIDTTKDLLNMILENHTGTFQPKVITYNNYYNPGNYQNFGIDLETRCRLDKKVVPLIISTILSFMDQLYPEMSNDKIRTSTWTLPVKLAETHKLRSILNEIPFTDNNQVLNILRESHSEPTTIASVLKIYLLELPEPLITNNIYDVLKVLYNDYPPTRETSTEGKSMNKKVEKISEKISEENERRDNENDDDANDDDDDTTAVDDIKPDNKSNPRSFSDANSESGLLLENKEVQGSKEHVDQKKIDDDRIKGLSTILTSLSKPHIATLDAISTHFYRLIKIIKMGDDGEKLAKDFKDKISQEFANCIIKINKPDELDLGCKIFYDLLTNKKQIFRELKKSKDK